MMEVDTAFNSTTWQSALQNDSTAMEISRNLTTTNGTLFRIDNGTKDDVTEFSMDSPDSSNLRYGFYSKWDDYTIGAVYLSMGVVGAILNFLTIFIIGFGTNLNKEVKIQLINLAIADLLMALTNPAFYMVKVLNINFLDNLSLCKMTRFISQSALHAGPLCHVVIATERFVIIFFPFRASRYTQTHKLIVVGVIWLFALAPEIESLIYSKIKMYDQGQILCSFESPLSKGNKALDDWLVTLKHILPSIAIFVIYVMIFVKLSVRKTAGLHQHLSKRWKKGLDKVRALI